MPLEILPGLWLSNKFDNFNKNFLKNKNINCIFSTKMIKTNYEFIYIPFNLNTNDNINELNKLFVEYISDFISFINKKLKQFKNILLYCDDGNHICPSIIAAYIIKYGFILPDKTIRYIQYKSKYAFTDEPLFYPSLVHVFNQNQ